MKNITIVLLLILAVVTYLQMNNPGGATRDALGSISKSPMSVIHTQDNEIKRKAFDANKLPQPTSDHTEKTTLEFEDLLTAKQKEELAKLKEFTNIEDIHLKSLVTGVFSRTDIEDIIALHQSQDITEQSIAAEVAAQDVINTEINKGNISDATVFCNAVGCEITTKTPARSEQAGLESVEYISPDLPMSNYEYHIRYEDNSKSYYRVGFFDDRWQPSEEETAAFNKEMDDIEIEMFFESHGVYDADTGEYILTPENEIKLQEFKEKLASRRAWIKGE